MSKKHKHDAKSAPSASAPSSSHRDVSSQAGPNGFPLSWSDVVQLVVLYALVLVVSHLAGLLWGLAAAVGAAALRWRAFSSLIRFALWDQWVAIDRSTRDMDLIRKGFDWRPVVVLSMVAVILTGNNYFGHRQHFRYFAARLLAKKADKALLHGATLRHAGNHRGVQVVYARRFSSRFGKWARILEFGYWVSWRVVGFFLIPLLVVLLLPGERVRDYGLSVKGLGDHLWIYLVLFGIVLPAVIVVSYTPGFKSHYPFPWSGMTLTAPVDGRLFVAWELIYALQFFSLEFFFRGFVLSALRRSMGAYAIFAMVVPYCMIHFGKPLPETLGAIVAGTVLGTLALGTRSIWSGVFIHVSVAWTMDIAALIQKGAFPRHW